ncbi:MAG: hypothetical protein U9Q81_07795 [Pseudomonadota bacterium]|nr:hypothetical protein [Pseudomonadota bacterium]
MGRREPDGHRLLGAAEPNPVHWTSAGAYLSKPYQGEGLRRERCIGFRPST